MQGEVFGVQFVSHDCKVDGDMNSSGHACHDPFCELGA